MTALSSYSTGTVSVSADGTTVTGTGPLWLSTGNVKPGDRFQAGHFEAIITDVTDDTHLVITPWPGSTISGAAYVVWKVSQQRIVGETYAASVDKLVGALNTSGFYVFVDANATAPDPSLGYDGQYALQPTTGKTWASLGGVWTFLGIYKAFQLKGAWSGATAYAAGDVVTLSGSSYVCVLDHTNNTPPNATYWQLLASIGATGNTGPTGASYGGTSTTSLAIGTGSKVFTTQAGLAYQDGARVRASSAANTSNWMEGLATYSGTALTINVDKTNGSGTLADWNLNVVGQPGAGDLSSANNLSDLANTATARLNLGLDQNQRVNSYLDRIYLSKALGFPRRVVGSWATGFKAASDTLRGILTASSSNYDTTNAVASGYISPAGVIPTTVQINPPASTVAAQTYTQIDRTTAVLNGVTVSKVGVYSTVARTIKLKIVLRNAANNYTAAVDQSYSHGGSGWEDATLTTPYTVPSSGTYYLGAYVASGGSNPNATGVVNRTYVQADLTGTMATTAEDSNTTFPMRYVYVTPAQIAQNVGTAIGDMTSGGGLAAAFDGVTSQGQAAGATGSVANSSGNVGKDGGSGITRKIIKFSAYASNDVGFTGAGGNITLYLEGSSDNSSWTTLFTSAAFANANSAIKTYTDGDGIVVTTAYRYHRVRVVSSTGSSLMRMAEVQFFEAPPGLSNMTIVTTMQTADVSVSAGRILIEYDNYQSPILNTDLTAEVTCDGGSNWSTAPLSIATAFSQNGLQVAESNLQSCTSGTSFAARVKSLNGKDVRIYGVSISV
ncbi:hypothetical protein J4G48_0020255 [Bradyrhizobium barranii subsp. apii]|uniref:carbohydrate-binding protein n=1 Tax=Bradyrhizobium barranii TaxID=2992140 RepID=UPI001CD52D6A|nr:carbohydrate-binding protein [Bradyrhizobium barranii]UPU00217.1 hypothetical protein J4G48_0020255 [Bradyrhizobium barranii subsp. apii]